MVPTRSISVKSRSLLALTSAMLLAGCGGGVADGGFNGPPGEVSGVIFDIDGNPVRSARVYTTDGNDRETDSNSSGSYVLRDVSSSDLVIRAEVAQGGVRYIGQNVARVFENERSKSVNIVVVDENTTATVRGTVRTFGGGLVEGARVLALGTGGLSSSIDITDSEGRFVINRLSSDVDYQIIASAPQFQSDVSFVDLAPGEDRTVNFDLDDSPGAFAIGPPSGLSAVAWTSPEMATRSTESAAAFEAIKREFDPRRSQSPSGTRQTIIGTTVEVDLSWNPINNDFLLGYGIYRAEGFGALRETDFLRDPLANFYADADDLLNTQTQYSFAISSINVDSIEGTRSSSVTAETLGDVIAQDPEQGPLRFRWFPTNGAEEYVVFLYDVEPRIGVASIWNNAASPTANTFVSGPSLSSGTYYFVVLALANGQTSRSISEIRSFVVN